MGIGAILAILALVLEVIHWAVTHDSSLSFFALVALTLAVLVEGALPLVRRS